MKKLKSDIEEYKKYAQVTAQDKETLFIVATADCRPAPYDSRLKSGVIDEHFKSSLRTKGQDYPVKAVKCEDGTYEIWDGRRRYAAIKELGIPTIKVLLVDPPDDPSNPREMRRLKSLAFRTNYDRQELTGFETIMLIEEMALEGYKNTEIAKEIDVSEAYISQIRAIFKSSELSAALKNNELGESGVNKARAISKVKDPLIQKRLIHIARLFTITSFQSIILGYEAISDGTFKIDERISDLVLQGKLEPKSLDRLKALSKLRSYEQQFEMAKILIARTEKALLIVDPVERENAIPSIEDIQEWIAELKKEAALAAEAEAETEPEEPLKFTFSPLTPTKLSEAFDLWTDKYKTAKKDGADPLKVAEMRGLLKGIKLAGGYEKT